MCIDNVPLHEKQINDYYLQHFKKQIIPTKDPRWGRLIGIWHENRNSKIYTHAYAYRIDKVYGGYYLDCLPTKVFIKTFCQLLARPIFTLLKTIYHISMLPIFMEINQACEQHRFGMDNLKNCFKSLVDIIRTPLYGITLTIASIGVLYLGILNPNTIFAGNAFLGEIERHANWGDRHTFWTLGGCFQPFPWEKLLEYKQEENTDTLYPDSDPASKQLTNFTRARILYMREHFDKFDCQQLGKYSSYISPILSTEMAHLKKPFLFKPN